MPTHELERSSREDDGKFKTIIIITEALIPVGSLNNSAGTIPGIAQRDEQWRGKDGNAINDRRFRLCPRYRGRAPRLRTTRNDLTTQAPVFVDF